jgi:hypothetical protein
MKFPAVPEKPSRADAAAALGVINRALAGFPFDADHDRSIAVAAILTALVRRSLKSAPLLAFNAPKMGSGKSLLADSVSLIATGRRASVMSHNTKAEEEAKRLISVLIEGDPVVCIDNISEPLSSDALCSVLTQETYKDRVLGMSKTATVPTCVTWLATGNNLTFEGDMTTRVLRCDLDPKCERPEERSFSVNLHDWIPAHRGELVAAALTILRAFHVAGRPAHGLPTFGRFEEWDGLVRGALVWLGMADPCLSRQDLEEADPVRTALKTVLAAWHEIFQHQAVTTNEVISKANEFPGSLLQAAILEVAGQGNEISARRFGKWLKKFEKRVEGGYRLEQAGVRNNVAQWSVKNVSGYPGFTGFATNHMGKVSGANTPDNPTRGAAANPVNQANPAAAVTLFPAGDREVDAL